MRREQGFVGVGVYGASGVRVIAAAGLLGCPVWRRSVSWTRSPTLPDGVVVGASADG